MKILFYSLVIIYITLSCEKAFSERKEEEMLNDILMFEIKTDKDVYKIGDEIVIKCYLKNKSNMKITIIPWDKHNWISFYNQEGKEIKQMSLIYRELKIIPDKEDFVTLAPNESYNATIKGTIKKDIIYKKRKIEGLLIDFEDKAFIIGKAGIFEIKAVYKGDQLWKEQGKKRYNFDNIWTGKIESNEIYIKIQ